MTIDLLNYYGVLGIFVFGYVFYKCQESPYLTEDEIKKLNKKE